jgi:hypothetical protein
MPQNRISRQGVLGLLHPIIILGGKDGPGLLDRGVQDWPER